MTQRLSFAAEYLSVDRLYDGTIARGETGKAEVLTSAEVKAWCDLKDQDEFRFPNEAKTQYLPSSSNGLAFMQRLLNRLHFEKAVLLTGYALLYLTQVRVGG